MATTRTLMVFGFVVLLTSFSPRGFTDDFTSDDSDDSDDSWGDSDDSGMGCSSSSDDDWDDDSSDDSWSSDDDWGDDDGYDWDDDDAWEDDDWDGDDYDDSYSSSDSSSGMGCSDYDSFDDDYDDTYDDTYDDYGGSGWGCSGPYLAHDSCKERCRDRYDRCMKDFGYCQDWDAAVVDAGDCPDCSIEHQECVEQC